MFYGHPCAHGKLYGTSIGNEAQSKMKQPLDMTMSRFEHGGSDLWSNTLPLDLGEILGLKPKVHSFTQWLTLIH